MFRNKVILEVNSSEKKNRFNEEVELTGLVYGQGGDKRRSKVIGFQDEWECCPKLSQGMPEVQGWWGS